MQFRLPEQLQNELLAYDPQLKALAKEAKAKTSTRKKTAYPLGQPHNIIPADVVRESLLNDAITNINSNNVNYRFHSFTRVVNVATPEAKTIPYAILYHWENIWYAAWMPPKGKEDEYVYGYSYMFKDTAAARKSMPYKIKHDTESWQQTKIGRSIYYYKSVCVTKQMIIDGHDTPGWNIAGVPSYYNKSQQLKPAIIAFENTLRASIPTWNDSNGIFDRIKSASLANILFSYNELNGSYFKTIDKTEWMPSFQELKALIIGCESTGYSSTHDWRVLNKIMHIIDTPFFRKWIQSKCDETISHHKDLDNNCLKNVKRPWNEMLAALEMIQKIHRIWPDCPIDYYQNHINILTTVDIWDYSNEVKEWLGINMPVASFFNMIQKYYNSRLPDVHLSNRHRYENTQGVVTFRFGQLNDTSSMLHNLIKKEMEIPVPKRWRIEEFHDSIQAEAWKIKNDNVDLPQDLFPTPIKIELENNKWTFFQPTNTHQLAQWGQAVRNCVGSSSNYAEGVKKKQHFIVLCMLDGKPLFTVQLDVSMGMMSVKQITGLSNKSLTEDQRDLYTKAFGQALKLRNEQLTQAPEPTTIS